MEYLNFINNLVNDFVHWTVQDVVHILGAIVVIDIVLGFTKAIAGNDFSSYKARTGVVSHTFALIVAVVAHTFGQLNGMEFFDTALWLLTLAYVGSILENLAILGVPVPAVVTDKLKQVQDFFNNKVEGPLGEEAKKVIDNKQDEEKK